MHVALPLLLSTLPLLVRSCLSWHYPNSPKNRKTVLSPCHDWLKRGSVLKKDPLRIWFYPQ
ncbi:serine/threonine protein kinase [Salmonella enterica subsp. enterica serovar Haga]|nr:serine/threonine protein kinase [Salmonella enterica subsp. enterica serovar Haga]